MDRNEIEELIERLEKRTVDDCVFDESTASRINVVQIPDEDCSEAAFALRHLLQAQTWRPISDEAKNGKPHLFLCRWQDQVGYAEVQIVLSWEIDGWFDWDNVKLDDSIPVAYVPLPQSSFEERASATPSEQQNEGEE